MSQSPMRTLAIASASLLLCTYTPFHAIAQDESALERDQRECAQLSNPNSRRVCLESLQSAPSSPEYVESTNPAAASAPIAVRPGAVPQEIVDQPERSSSGQEPAYSEKETYSSKDSGPDLVLVDTVATLERVESTKWIITLKSGQVWKQTTGKAFALRQNDIVTFTPTRWGSDYRLRVDGRPGYIQVTRLR
jgi:hypothetical protein